MAEWPVAWEDLLQEISKPGQVLLWVKVPSHVDVLGNEETDRLSNVGCLSHPQYPTKAAPALLIISSSAPPPPPQAKKMKPNIHEASFHTPIVPRMLDLSFFAVLSPEPVTVPHGNTHALWQELGLQVLPDSPLSSAGSCCSCSADCSCDAHSTASSDSQD